MRMDNGTDIGSFLIDTHVHFDFGRRSESLVCLDYITVRINLADKFRGHKSLRYAGRRA